MIKNVLARIQQGHRTMKFPDGPPPPLPERFRGRPMIEPKLCPADCVRCAQACPTGAIQTGAETAPGRMGETPMLLTGKMPVLRAGETPATRAPLRVDLGKCLFCGDCANACPTKAIRHDRDYRLAVRQREHLVVGAEPLKLAEALEVSTRRLFGRSLRLRQVSAGGCNACEADTNVLGTVGWDLGRFGVQFVASPRHADGLLITGPVTANMRLALEKTYQATPAPKIVIAVGACAIAGGPYIDHAEVHNGAAAVVPVDLFIPGCPPNPLTILDGILRLLGRIQ